MYGIHVMSTNMTVICAYRQQEQRGSTWEVRTLPGCLSTHIFKENCEVSMPIFKKNWDVTVAILVYNKLKGRKWNIRYP